MKHLSGTVRIETWILMSQILWTGIISIGCGEPCVWRGRNNDSQGIEANQQNKKVEEYEKYCLFQDYEEYLDIGDAFEEADENDGFVEYGTFVDSNADTNKEDGLFEGDTFEEPPNDDEET